MATLDEMWPVCPEGCKEKPELLADATITHAGVVVKGVYFRCIKCDIEGPTRDTIEEAKVAFEGMIDD